jgi:hypothetical protein
MSDKLTDVRQRIAESEVRIAQLQERIRTDSCDVVAETAVQLYSAVSTLRELKAYEARLAALAAPGGGTGSASPSTPNSN